MSYLTQAVISVVGLAVVGQLVGVAVVLVQRHLKRGKP